MPIKLIWRLRRKQQIKKRYLTKEYKQKVKVLCASIKGKDFQFAEK